MQPTALNSKLRHRISPYMTNHYNYPHQQNSGMKYNNVDLQHHLHMRSPQTELVLYFNHLFVFILKYNNVDLHIRSP